MERNIRRGDIYYAELSLYIGSEQGGNGPVLIISNDIGNRYSPTVIIAAITSRQAKTKLPTHYYLTDVKGVPEDSIVDIRTLDKKRLGAHLTRLDEQNINAIAKPLLISIGLDNQYLVRN